MFIAAGILQPIIDGLMQILAVLYQLTGNYGWAILLLAVLIKIALYYPTKQQFKTMKEMQVLQPEIKRLQGIYKDEPQKLQTEQMLLFKKHKVNPFGGCLPLLVQFPFLWAIYYAIKNNEAQFINAAFLWIGGPLSLEYPKIFASSLAVADIPLLLIYGYSMYLTSRLGMVDNSMGASQIYMTVGLPVVFTYMMWKWNFPSALVLYWLAFNLLSIIHQSFMMREEVRFQIDPPAHEHIDKGGKQSASGGTNSQNSRRGNRPGPAKTGSGLPGKS